jgi:hypothetical protein
MIATPNPIPDCEMIANYTQIVEDGVRFYFLGQYVLLLILEHEYVDSILTQ